MSEAGRDVSKELAELLWGAIFFPICMRCIILSCNIRGCIGEKLYWTIVTWSPFRTVGCKSPAGCKSQRLTTFYQLSLLLLPKALLSLLWTTTWSSSHHVLSLPLMQGLGPATSCHSACWVIKIWGPEQAEDSQATSQEATTTTAVSYGHKTSHCPDCESWYIEV